MKQLLLGGVLTLVLLSLSATTVHADFVYYVSVNTSALSTNNNLTAPFGIDFELTSGGVAATNTATLSNFNFGGVNPNPIGSPSSIGAAPNTLAPNVSGSLASTVTLEVDNATNFFADFNQGFNPGNTFSFQVDLTTNGSASSPDTFTFSLLENYGNLVTSQGIVLSNGTTIPTTDQLASSLVTIAITSNPSPQVFAGAPGTSLPSPTVTSVPEPRTLILFSIGFLVLAVRVRWQHRYGPVTASC